MIKPIGAARRALTDPELSDFVILGREGAISIAPDRGVVITGTVAFSALQFALAAGPERILLAGIDLTNDTEPRFYERRADSAPSGLRSGLRRILAGFSLAATVAGRRGIALDCASTEFFKDGKYHLEGEGQMSWPDGRSYRGQYLLLPT